MKKGCCYGRGIYLSYPQPFYLPFPSPMCGVKVTPYGRVEEDEQREQLKSSGKHVEHQHIFGENAEVIEALRRTCKFESRTDIVDCRGDCGEVGNQVFVF